MGTNPGRRTTEARAHVDLEGPAYAGRSERCIREITPGEDPKHRNIQSKPAQADRSEGRHH